MNAAAYEFIAFGRRTARRRYTVGFDSRRNHDARPLEIPFGVDRELDPIRLMLTQRHAGSTLIAERWLRIRDLVSRTSSVLS